MEGGRKILSIGVDIESVDRFKEHDKNGSFLKRIFTNKELEYCFSFTDFAQHLAVRYSGKEAVVKALSSVNEETVDYKEIEILNNDKGAPFVKLNNKNFEGLEIKISLSHCDDKVIAFVVII